MADADPDLSVLVAEGGPNNDKPSVAYPALFLPHLQPDSQTTIFYKGTKETNVAGRKLVVPAGGLLGGGSSINMMTYSRGQRSDFNAWNVPEWSTSEIVPYLKRVIESFITRKRCLLTKSPNSIVRDIPWSG